MMATPMDPRTAALNRGAQLWQTSAEQLVIKPWESSLELEHSMWVVSNPNIIPALPCLIAVSKTGRTFWVNDHYKHDELLRFMYAEGLVERLAHTPERLIDVLLLLRDNREKLLRSLEDIEEIGDIEQRKKDRARIASLRDQFYPPEAIPGSPLKLDFWTWTPAGGVVARWHLEFGDEAGDIIYDEVMDDLGECLLPLE